MQTLLMQLKNKTQNFCHGFVSVTIMTTPCLHTQHKAAKTQVLKSWHILHKYKTLEGR